jgi:choice-of-anchor C domain-containing protein
MRKLLSALLGICIFMMPVYSFAAVSNLVANGDFELPQITGNYYQTVIAGESYLTDWTIGGNSIDIVQGGLWMHTGTQAIDLAGTPGPGSVSQFISTNPGGSYMLSFFVSSNADQGSPFANSLNVYWGGTLLATISSPVRGRWDAYSFIVTGAAQPRELKFATDITSNQGPLLDTVRLEAVPIPGAVWLLGSGLMGLVIIGRRRFK